MKFTEPATAGGSSSLLVVSFSFALSPDAAARIRGLDGFWADAFLVFRLRYTPGFMLPPAFAG
jgi:hypothetical protein